MVFLQYLLIYKASGALSNIYRGLLVKTVLLVPWPMPLDLFLSSADMVSIMVEGVRKSIDRDVFWIYDYTVRSEVSFDSLHLDSLRWNCFYWFSMRQLVLEAGESHRATYGSYVRIRGE